MFNRNARNRLNTMGGIASFQNGGPTRNPNLYSRRFFINPKDTASDIQNSQMNYIQKIASQAKNQGIGSLSAKDQFNLNMAMGQFGGSKMVRPLTSALKGSVLEPFVETAGQAFGAFGPGTMSGISSVLLSGDPKDKGSFSGRLASMKPTDEFLNLVGLDSLPTKAEVLDEEAAIIGSPPGSIKKPVSRPPIAGGPTYQDPTLVDPRDPAVINRIQSEIDVKKLMEKATEGQGVRYNEKTGKYELAPMVTDPSVAEEEKGIAGELKRTDVQSDAQQIAEEENLIAGEVPKQKKIIKPKDAPKTDADVAEEERGIAGEITKDEIVKPKPTTREEVEKLITTGSQEEQQSELKQLMSEFKQNAPEYEGMDKNLALAKVFFSIAAGKDPDAITNIADGLNKGADMFLKDKKERDAFNRQVDLAALRYGLQERSKDRAQKFFIADQEVTVDGKKYAKGDVVSLTSGFIRKNGIPSGLTTETLTKAAMDNAASIKKALDKLSKDKIISPKDFNTFMKRVDDASLNFTKSRNLQTLIQGQIFNVSEGRITGGLNAGKALVKKAFDFAGIKMDKNYSNIAEYNRDMEEVANTLIQQILGEGSKNLSNVDRALAQQIVGLYTSGAKGVTGYAFVNDEVLLKRLQRINDKVQLTQQNSLAEIEDVLAATNGLTFQSGRAVKFAKIRDLGLYGKIQGTPTDKGAKTQTIKLGDLLSDGKFDKDKFNKLLIG